MKKNNTAKAKNITLTGSRFSMVVFLSFGFESPQEDSLGMQIYVKEQIALVS